MEFAARDLGDYAKQLDYFGIELAVVGREIHYAYDLASPKHRRSPRDEEKRIYFAFLEPSPLQQYDHQLLVRAGIPLALGKQVKFISPELENQLASIELRHARSSGHPNEREIAKTVFSSTPVTGGYVFKVVHQRYRK